MYRHLKWLTDKLALAPIQTEGSNADATTGDRTEHRTHYNRPNLVNAEVPTQFGSDDTTISGADYGINKNPSASIAHASEANTRGKEIRMALEALKHE